MNDGADKPHILVVDDDARLRDLLRKYLSEQGFYVTAATSAADARDKLALFIPDLLVLDIMMQGESGLELAASLRSSSPPPILLLSALGEPEDRIGGLEAGADDYLVKPFEPRELVLRIRTILRRAAERSPPRRTMHFGGYVFDLAAGTLYHDGGAVYLTSSEGALLRALAESAGNAVSREALAIAASGTGADEPKTDTRSVDVQINRLRKKIEPEPGKPLYIQTVRGAGYVLKAE